MKNYHSFPAIVFCAAASVTIASAQDAFNDIGPSINDQYSALLRQEAAKLEEEKNDIHGIEALASWRSEYVYRGFSLASSSMEFQLAAQIALSDDYSLDTGVYYGTETGQGTFSELTGFANLIKSAGDFTYSAKLAYHEYGQSIFDSGVDLGLSVRYQMNDNFDVSGTMSYDTGAEGFYFESKLSYYEEVDTDSYLVWDTGVSAVAEYYDRDGIHHAFSKLSYTYNINDSVSVSPYVSAVLGIHEETKNHLLGGVYFAVSF
jgi:hypothetical protein